jgi:hypothetical protein
MHDLILPSLVLLLRRQRRGRRRLQRGKFRHLVIGTDPAVSCPPVGQPFPLAAFVVPRGLNIIVTTGGQQWLLLLLTLSVECLQGRRRRRRCCCCCFRWWLALPVPLLVGGRVIATRNTVTVTVTANANATRLTTSTTIIVVVVAPFPAGVDDAARGRRLLLRCRREEGGWSLPLLLQLRLLLLLTLDAATIHVHGRGGLLFCYHAGVSDGDK